ncbi:MAG TPA: O-unit flippase [Firmicutes bacterium]|nr:O-unit flippase [Bacillota bacterium]
MRVKNSLINSVANIVVYILTWLPTFVVRKVFLMTLGNDILGLNSLYVNVIGLMSIFDLGIGTAIVFSLYKPFAEENREKIKAYLNYYKKFYQLAGGLILIVGLFVTPVLQFFVSAEIPNIDVYRWFILALINTVIGYFYSYQLCILQVAQLGYKISIGQAISKTIISSLQIVTLLKFKQFDLYLIVEIIINILYYVMMNTYILKHYAWLKVTRGELEVAEKKDLFKNIKAMFLHKLGYLLVNSTDNLIIARYISLGAVGMFNSYKLVIVAAENVFWKGMSGVSASIGDFMAQNSKESVYEVHKKLYFLNFWLASFIVIALYHTVTPFIVLWLGMQQVMDGFSVGLILINSYLYMMRYCVHAFKEGAGVYHEDRFAPLFEASINLVLSIGLVQVLGLPGVMLGTLVSHLSVVFWVNPKVVYQHVFNQPLSHYFKRYILYLVIAMLAFGLTYGVTLPLKEHLTIWTFLLNCGCNIVLINALYLVIFWKTREFQYFKDIGFKILQRQLKGR